MYVCMSVCLSVCVCVCMYVCMYISMHAHVRIYIYIYIYVYDRHIHIHIKKYVYTQICLGSVKVRNPWGEWTRREQDELLAQLGAAVVPDEGSFWMSPGFRF